MSKALNVVLLFLSVNIFLSTYAYIAIPQPINYVYLVMVVVSLLLLVGLLLAIMRGDLDD